MKISNKQIKHIRRRQAYSASKNVLKIQKEIEEKQEDDLTIFEFFLALFGNFCLLLAYLLGRNTAKAKYTKEKFAELESELDKKYKIKS